MTTTGYTVSRLYDVFDVLRLALDADMPLLVGAPARTTALCLLAKTILDDLALDATPEDADAFASAFLQRLSEPGPAVVTLSRTTIVAWFAGRRQNVTAKAVRA